MVTNRRKLNQTGGDVNKAPLVSTVNEVILLVINNMTVNDLNHCYDDDYIKEKTTDENNVIVYTSEINAANLLKKLKQYLL